MVVSMLIQVVEEANFHYIRPSGMNARAVWLALEDAHEDHTSGGQMFWLQKLIMTKMEVGADAVEHIGKMTQLYYRLNALVTKEKPLTADEIFATCLLISLPADWLPPVSHLFQKATITSSEVTIALEREAVRRSSKDVFDPVSVSQASVSTRCSFCRRKGHDLSKCRAEAKILKESGDQRSNDNNSASSSSQNRSSRRTDSSQTENHKSSLDGRNQAAVAVPLDLSDSNDSLSHQALTTRAFVLPSEVEQSSVKASLCRKQEWLADTGCSHIMSPDLEDIVDSHPSQVNIRLADHSTIKSTHQGFAALPFKFDTPPSALLVPDLKELLLSISSVCDGGFEVLFTSSTMEIYPSGSLSSAVNPKAAGYRRNNLYYLPNDVQSHSPPSCSLKAHAMSLFDWHCCLGHIGLKPLRHLLRSHQLSPSSNNDINVQKCTICVQSKMH